MSNNDDESISNPSDNKTFQEIVAARFSRRSFLEGGLAAAAGAMSIGGISSLLRAVPAHASPVVPLLGFSAIPVSSADTCGSGRLHRQGIDRVGGSRV